MLMKQVDLYYNSPTEVLQRALNIHAAYTLRDFALLSWLDKDSG